MADALSQQIMERIKTDMESILISNGAVKDINTVRDRKTSPWKSTELPAINIEDSNSVVTKNGNNHINELAVSIELVTTGTDHIKDARNFTSDIIKILGSDYQLNNLIQKMSAIDVESTDDEQESVKLTTTTLTFTATYITPIFDQFQLD
jgi:hypothetical protein